MKRETTAVLIATKDKKYALWMKLKAGSMSDPSEERMVQDIVVDDDNIMTSIQHCWTLDDLLRSVDKCSLSPKSRWRSLEDLQGNVCFVLFLVSLLTVFLL